MAFPSWHTTAVLTAACAAAFLPATIRTAGAAGCEEITAGFERAVAARSIADAKRAYDEFTLEPFWNRQVPARASGWPPSRSPAPTPPTPPRRIGRDAVAIAQNTLSLTGSWGNTAALATYFMNHGERAQGHAWYELAMKRQNAPGVAASSAERLALLNTTGAAKRLANDDQEGRKEVAYVASGRDADGKLGGIYAALRADEVVVVPLPINFYYNEAQFTPEGVKALEEFVKAAREREVRVMRWSAMPTRAARIPPTWRCRNGASKPCATRCDNTASRRGSRSIGKARASRSTPARCRSNRRRRTFMPSTGVSSGSATARTNRRGR